MCVFISESSQIRYLVLIDFNDAKIAKTLCANLKTSKRKSSTYFFLKIYFLQNSKYSGISSWYSLTIILSLTVLSSMTKNFQHKRLIVFHLANLKKNY